MNHSPRLPQSPPPTDDPDGERPLAMGRYHAYKTQLIRNLPFWSPCLVWVQVGAKRLAGNGREARAQAGELLLIPAGIRCGLENLPDPLLGEYRSLAFELDSFYAESIARQLSLSFAPLSAPAFIHCVPASGLQQSLEHLRGAVRDLAVHPAIVRHRLLEVLMQWVLQDSTVWSMLLPRAATVTVQVQALVAQAPDAPWTLERLAELTHRSVATLSRQLKNEKTGLRAILDDVRLVRAFSLLQTTRASVDQIARQCGYQSVPRFSERFRDYFGVTPAQLRRTREEN